jgi:uncharacterized protein YbjQ (UPF0145 family)
MIASPRQSGGFVHISGMSGNEIFCLAQKGYMPGELVVGNSVWSLGVGGALGAFGSSVAGGEISQVTSMISEGRHGAITRMEEHARANGAIGITSVTTELRSLAGYTEFLSQGTSIHKDGGGDLFSSAASGMQLYCHLDAGYHPKKFAMGNVAYALGITRGFVGSIRTMARGEVREYSDMYNKIRHLALQRLQKEAFDLGANSVVDVGVKLLPYGAGSVELLMTGTACTHARFGTPASASDVVTSELTGEELWNMATLGYAPVQLIMTTSVYALGVAGGIGTWFKSMSRGELPQVTQLIYDARENCLGLMRKEATALGAERVIGNRLHIHELAPGLIEIMVIGTAIKKLDGIKPESPLLIPQAIIIDKDLIEVGPLNPMPGIASPHQPQVVQQAQNPAGQLIGCAVAIIMVSIFIIVPLFIAFCGAVLGN